MWNYIYGIIWEYILILLTVLYSTVPLIHTTSMIVILTCIKTDSSAKINFFQCYHRNMDGMGTLLMWVPGRNTLIPTIFRPPIKTRILCTMLMTATFPIFKNSPFIVLLLSKWMAYNIISIDKQLMKLWNKPS